MNAGTYSLVSWNNDGEIGAVNALCIGEKRTALLVYPQDACRQSEGTGGSLFQTATGAGIISYRSAAQQTLPTKVMKQ